MRVSTFIAAAALMAPSTSVVRAAESAAYASATIISACAHSVRYTDASTAYVDSHCSEDAPGYQVSVEGTRAKVVSGDEQVVRHRADVVDDHGERKQVMIHYE